MTSAAAHSAPPADHAFRNSLIAAILEASPDGILVVDAGHVIVSHNQRLFEVLGISPGQLSGRNHVSLASLPDRPLLSLVLDLVHDADAFLSRVKALYDDPMLEDQCEVSLKDGRTLERHSSPLWGPDGRYLGRVWYFRDISGRKRTELTLQALSLRDSLTGTANRRHFFDTAAREFVRARRFGRDLSFVMVDLDAFKQINDRWGHAAGDKVLRAFCECSLSELRQVDLFARIGGEEFAILVADTDLDGAYLLAERLRERAAALGVAEGEDTIGFTLSAGVASVEAHDSSPEDVLKRADAALYSAKNAGRNRTMRAG